ncbi:jg20082 [Pararge aegeria aegeria]|uniref:Jg20082 protein n=1 Tax=Pararge aegeria aegeria TaxID=348720 RepID=A0A8S4QVU0_9NEOP|nr:jg20082 [Pararge aegeria aegeria]
MCRHHTSQYLIDEAECSFKSMDNSKFAAASVGNCELSPHCRRRRFAAAISNKAAVTGERSRQALQRFIAIAARKPLHGCAESEIIKRIVSLRAVARQTLQLSDAFS